MQVPLLDLRQQYNPLKEQFMRAIEQVARSEADFLAFLQEGVDDIEAGRIVEHDQVMTELDEMIARHEARCDD